MENGRHSISVSAPGYKPMTGEFEMIANNTYSMDLHLDPITEPREVQPAFIASLHRPEETVFVGFVVDDDSGAPLASVLVRTEPSGRETQTDARGFFQIYVPVKTLAEATTSPAKLILEKPGFQSEERQYLELWSEGDWIYRIRLDFGITVAKRIYSLNGQSFAQRPFFVGRPTESHLYSPPLRASGRHISGREVDASLIPWFRRGR